LIKALLTSIHADTSYIDRYTICNFAPMISIKAAFLLGFLAITLFETPDARRINHDELKQTEQGLATDKAPSVQLPRCATPAMMVLYTDGFRGPADTFWKSGGGPPGCYMCEGTTKEMAAKRTKKDAWERCYKPGKQCTCPWPMELGNSALSFLNPWPMGPMTYNSLAGPGHPEATK